MAKRVIKAMLVGAMAGVAVNAIAALAVSYWLRLGYYMPCLATLPEQVGGELNGALLQMLFAAAAGAAVGVLWQWGSSRAKRRAGPAGAEAGGRRRAARRGAHVQSTGACRRMGGASAASCEALSLDTLHEIRYNKPRTPCARSSVG